MPENMSVPDVRLVTTFWPLTMTGGVERLVQAAGEPRFVVNCKVSPAALLGHVKTIFPAEAIILGVGGAGNEMLNSVP
jgi:hypothetical protein